MYAVQRIGDEVVSFREADTARNAAFEDFICDLALRNVALDTVASYATCRGDVATFGFRASVDDTRHLRVEDVVVPAASDDVADGLVDEVLEASEASR